MLKELKKCQSIKEICQTISDKQVENGAGYLLIIWAVLPIWIIVSAALNKLVTKCDAEEMQRVFVDGYTGRMCIVAALNLVYIIASVIRNNYTNKNWIKERITCSIWNKSFIMYYAWMIFSTFFSINVIQSLCGTRYRNEGLFTYLAYAAIFFTAQSIRSDKFKILIYRITFVVSCILSIFQILEDADMFNLRELFINNRSVVFFAVNYYGNYLCMAMLCSMGLLLYDKNKKWNIAYILGVALQLYSMFVNNTFSTYLGVLFVIILMSIITFICFKNKEDYRCIRKNMGILIGLFVLSSAMSWMDMIPTSSGENLRVNVMTLFSDIQSVAGDEEDAETAGTGRFGMWKVGIKMVPKSPIVGFGLENLDQELKDQLWIDRVENEYLQCAIFIGIPGLIFFLVMLLSLSFHSIKNINMMTYSGIIGAMAVAGHACTSFLSNSMYCTEPYFYIFLGMMSGAWINSTNPKEKG